jgi:hypothetical protein
MESQTCLQISSIVYAPDSLLCNEGSSFNWADILSTNLIDVITTVKGVEPRTFLYFHMSSYLLDIMCVAHQYEDGLGMEVDRPNHPHILQSALGAQVQDKIPQDM